MASDLARGGAGPTTASITPSSAAPAPAPVQAPAAAPVTTPSADGCAGKKKTIASLISGC
jgi:hypothetical protein